MNGLVTVLLNDVKIHDKVKVGRPTFLGFPAAQSFAEISFDSFMGIVSKGPIRLQGENSEVRFANIAIMRLYNDDGEED